MSSFTLSSALVTGGWGYIGSQLVRKLLEGGVEVIVVDTKAPSAFFKDFILDVNWIPGLLEDPKILSNLQGVDAVFHLAGRADVKTSVEDPNGDFRANVIPTLTVLDWARHRGVKRFLFASSVSVCDPNQRRPFSENAHIRPSSPYGAAKAAGEAYCSAYSRAYGLHTTTARLFNVYGPTATRLFVADVARMILTGAKTLALWGGGAQVRDYLYIKDVVQGLLFLCEKGLPGQTYNLASGHPITLSNLAKQLAKTMTGDEMQVINRGPTYPGDMMEWFADVSKIKALGYRPRYSLEDGLKETALWIRTYRDWFLSSG